MFAFTPLPPFSLLLFQKNTIVHIHNHRLCWERHAQISHGRY